MDNNKKLEKLNLLVEKCTVVPPLSAGHDIEISSDAMRYLGEIC